MSDSNRRCPGYLAVCLIALAASLVSSVTTVALYDHWLAQKVVTMDLKGYIRQQRDLLLAGKLDEAGLRKRLDDLEAALLAVPANQTVLLKDVVVRNGREIKP